MNKRKIGNKYEDEACVFLENTGYTIINRNYQKSCGEIDIIAKKEDIISFIEVKYRKSDYLYSPCESVTISKQQKIIKTAQNYIFEKISNCNYNYTFDIIEIVGNPKNINHIINAFGI